jgi:hypothetical protein
VAVRGEALGVLAEGSDVEVDVDAVELLLARPGIHDGAGEAAAGLATDALLELDLALAAHEVDAGLGDLDVGAGGDARRTDEDRDLASVEGLDEVLVLVGPVGLRHQLLLGLVQGSVGERTPRA